MAWWGPSRASRTNTKKRKKDVLFIIGNCNAKVGNQKYLEEQASLALEYKMQQGKGKQNSSKRIHWLYKHPLPTTQEMTLHMDITRCQYWNQTDYILCSQRYRSSIQSAKTRPGADYGTDHELLIAKFRLKLKKAGKTTRPFRYDLNQTP